MNKIVLSFFFLLLFSFSQPVRAFLLNNTVQAGDGYNNVTITKYGDASCTSFLGLLSFGDCSVYKATSNGEITNLAYYDILTKSFLGFKKITLRAYGN